MTIERTLSIIKPDVVGRNLIGDVIHRFENAGLTVVGAKMVHLRPEQAMRFYQEHRKKPFFMELVDYMVSGPIMLMVLEGDNAVMRHRELIETLIRRRRGPARSDPTTLRPLRRTQCMVLTQSRARSARSPSSSQRAKSARGQGSRNAFPLGGAGSG